MKRNFTPLLGIALLTLSTSCFSQCLTGGSFTAASTYTFDVNTQGLSGDFGWVSAGSGELESTPVSAGTTKVLTTSTLFLPNSATTIAWSYDLGGSANVTSYSVDAIYNSGASVVSVCSGGTLSTTGGNLVFAAVAPNQIIGQNFQIRITFISGSSGSKVLNIDNFKLNASAGNQSTLPVTISYFNGAITTGAVKLTWLVASEINVNRYEIERSSNGKTYSKIGQVLASALTTYIYADATATSGSNYYRLKAIDNDGKYKYSSVVLIKLGKSSLASTLKLYPTVTSNSVTVEYISAVNSIDVVSMDGKLLKTVKPIEGSTQASISVSNLNAGLYLLRFSTSEGETASLKLIKQ
jgi:hypothetical protein